MANFLNRLIDKWFPPVPPPKPGQAKAAPATKARRAQPAPQPAAPAITYEQWLNGEGKAPRGKGQEWQARRKCERAIDRMKRYQGSDTYRRRFQTGSYNYRRADHIHRDKGAIWNECIAISEAVCAASDGYWEGKWDIIKEVQEYGTSMFQAYF